jgi:hypothetical protein
MDEPAENQRDEGNDESGKQVRSAHDGLLTRSASHSSVVS